MSVLVRVDHDWGHLANAQLSVLAVKKVYGRPLCIRRTLALHNRIRRLHVCQAVKLVCLLLHIPIRCDTRGSVASRNMWNERVVFVGEFRNDLWAGVSPYLPDGFIGNQIDLHLCTVGRIH